MMNRSFDIQQEYQKCKPMVQPFLQTAAQKSQYHDSDMIDLCQNDEQLVFDNAAYMPSLEMLTKVLPVLDIQVWDVEPFTDDPGRANLAQKDPLVQPNNARQRNTLKQRVSVGHTDGKDVNLPGTCNGHPKSRG